jgi:hypothetical protein
MIRPSVSEDVALVASNIRDEDRAEVEMLTGMTPMEALSLGFLGSPDCITGVGKGGAIVCMAGVAPTDTKGFASVWMLSTPAIIDNKREALVEGRKWLKRMRLKYGRLANVVSSANHVHLSLIQHMGFRLGREIQQAGVHRIPVTPFQMR